MSNLYNLTHAIHQLLPKINEKYGLKIKIETNWLINNVGFIELRNYNYNIANSQLLMIEAPQIRQILVGLQEALGKSEDYTEFKDIQSFEGYNPQDDIALRFIPFTKAEDLCHKWLDGLNALFDSEPEIVLQELIEILENLMQRA